MNLFTYKKVRKNVKCYDIWLELADEKVDLNRWLIWLEDGWCPFTGALSQYKTDDKYMFKQVPKELVLDLLIRHNR